MKLFYPETGTLEEWNAAYYRLEDYLRAHGVTNKVHQSQVILRLLQRAAARHAQTPQTPPIKLALEEAYSEIDRWFEALMDEPDERRASIVGRVNLYLLQAPERWPNVFLAPDGMIPPDFRSAMRDSSIQGRPDLSVSSMVPRPLDVSPAAELLEETWERISQVWVVFVVGLTSLALWATVFYLWQ
jgi:hypothetical protein